MIRLRVYLHSSAGDGRELDLTRKLVSTSLPIDERENKNLFSYGIVANKGALTIRDDNKEAVAFYNSYKKNELSIKILVENTIKKTSKLFLQYPLVNADYTPTNNILSININDNLDSWQNEEIPEIDIIDYINYFEGGSAYDLYEKLREYTPSNMRPQISSEDVEKLKNIRVTFPKLKSSNLWTAWQKVCELTQAHIWCDGGDGVGYAVHFAINGGN
jgi:hypothetical protein